MLWQEGRDTVRLGSGSSQGGCSRVGVVVHRVECGRVGVVAHRVECGSS